MLSWHLRNYPQATRRLDQLNPLTLSAGTWLEVLQGVRCKAELVTVKKMLELRRAVVLPLTALITQRAIDLMEVLTLTTGCKWAMR